MRNASSCLAYDLTKLYQNLLRDQLHDHHISVLVSVLQSELQTFLFCVSACLFCLFLPGDFSVNDPYRRCQSVIYTTYNALHWLAIEL